MNDQCELSDATSDWHLGPVRAGPLDFLLHHSRKRRQISEENSISLWNWVSLFGHYFGLFLHLLDRPEFEAEAEIPRVSY